MSIHGLNYVSWPKRVRQLAAGPSISFNMGICNGLVSQKPEMSRCQSVATQILCCVIFPGAP